MAIRNVDDNAIKEARLKMKAAYDAYKQSIRERDELVVKRLNEQWSVSWVSSQFGISEDKVEAIYRKVGYEPKS